MKKKRRSERIKNYRFNHEYFFTATGEPPLAMACVISIAIRKALNSARADAGNTDDWYQLGKFQAGRCKRYTTRILLMYRMKIAYFVT